jgi:hypothetical protein
MTIDEPKARIERRTMRQLELTSVSFVWDGQALSESLSL